MNGMVWDNLQRLKLAVAMIDDAEPARLRVVEALDALDDVIAEAWPPPQGVKPRADASVVRVTGAVYDEILRLAGVGQ